MKNKKIFFTEWAYIVGILFLAVGTALMERADFGMSMVVAPAYILHLKIAAFAPWFTFGMAEYCFQAVLLILIACMMRTFKKMYLFSFVTAVFYGMVLDFFMYVMSFLPFHGSGAKILFFLSGMFLCALGVAFLFHTYIAPEAYELFVKEFSEKYKKDMSKVKTAYDCCSCMIAIGLSFLFFGFGHFEGVKFGTVICALLNGWLIGQWSKVFEKHFIFKDGLRKV